MVKNKNTLALSHQPSRRSLLRRIALATTAVVIASSALSVLPIDPAAATVNQYDWQQTTGAQNVVDIKSDLLQEIASSSNGLIVLGIEIAGSKLYLSDDAGVTWRSYETGVNHNWSSIDVSSDGQHMVAAAWDGLTLVSDDAGATWTQRTIPGSDDAGVGKIALSDNGMTILATWGGSAVYLSTDNGVSWVQQTSIGIHQAWNYISVSGDGQALHLYSNRNLVYSSTDAGANWQSRAYGFGEISIAASTDATPDGNVVAVNSLSNVAITFDGGANWVETYTPTYGEYAIDVSSSGVVYAYERSGSKLYRTYDGESWDEVSSSIPSTIRWSRVVVSANGMRLTGTAATGGVYSSTNYGASWSGPVRVTGAIQAEVYRASADGRVILAGVHKGHLYISRDSGRTWQANTPIGVKTWTSMAVSNNGNTLAVVASDEMYVGRFYISTDGGASWTVRPLGVLGNYMGVALSISASGDLLVGAAAGGTIYTSVDHGVTWVVSEGAGGAFWNNVAISADGTKMIAAAQYGKVYRSVDRGATWQEITQLTGTSWGPMVYLSANGQRAIVMESNGSIFTSSDGGINWTERTALGQNAWSNSAVSADGMRLAVTKTWGANEFFLSFDAGVTWTTHQMPGKWPTIITFASATGDLVTASTTALYRATYATPFAFTPENNNQAEIPLSTDPAAPQPIKNVRPTFSGATYPNARVSVTVHSDPITCTTIADAQGNWSCTLPNAIPAGVHRIIVDVTNPTTNAIETIGPFYIQVAAGQTVITDTDVSVTAPNTGIAPGAQAAGTAMNGPASAAIGGSLLVQLALAVLLASGGFVATRLVVRRLSVRHRR